jgi:murein DD-endopeptidase MepM/ murein hydrolase activator NlpD
LKRRRGSDTVRLMSPPAKTGRARPTAPIRRREQQEARRRRFAVLIAIAAVGLGTLLVTAFGGGGQPAPSPPPASAAGLLPAGRPTAELIARLGALKLQLPVNASRVTAIGYFGSQDGSLALSPAGTQANEGLLRRLVHKLIGGGSGSPRWYLLPGGHGPSTSALDVGAPPGTDVYSPVSGTIVGIGKVVLNGRTYGARVDIQPSDAPSLIVSLSHLSADPSLTVGAMVSEHASKIGVVLDFSSVEHQALARYTNDAGNHVLIEVHPSATLQAR